MVDLPENEDGTFYRREVTVSFKGSVFEGSTPFRHAAEIEKIVRQLECIKPILMIYSDGGPDHRITYRSVKLALIILFKRLGIDVLIAARTAPGNSWANPAERVMSTPNLALQNTAPTRSESTSQFERVLNSANSMNDIRNKSSKVPGLKEAWLEPVKPIKTLLEDHTSRLSLKERQFKIQGAASIKEVTQVEKQLNSNIDPDIEVRKYQQQHLKSKKAHMQFLRDYCIERHYMFQIQKCNNPDCCTPRMSEELFRPLPDPMLEFNNKDHNRQFSSFALNEVTTEAHRPSASNRTPVQLQKRYR
ncbi:hypothetical protein FSP39_006187 [Pinctada imbricata]|uniref:Uncharacterized protein n=1 Tax=Pinctada imbricata TaxID=66713 RepID=A0AA88YL51_PINIB|nr:hypothetical protein FSP39_006187 [Pinctada imbricata]